MKTGVPEVLGKSGTVAVFKPQEAKDRDAKANAIIAYAKSIQDWLLLEAAVDQMLEDQTELVAWWDESVRGKGERANVAERGHFVEAATDLTGFTKQQVSKWRRRLKDRDQQAGSQAATPFLADYGLTKSLSSRWQLSGTVSKRLTSMPKSPVKLRPRLAICSIRMSDKERGRI